MAKLSAAEFAAKWAQRTAAATGAYKDGVNRVSESPTEKAADNLDKMVAGFNRAIESGKTERGLRGVSLQDWKTVTGTKGVANMAAGVSAAAGKVEKVAGALLSHIDAGQVAVAKLPSVTLEESIAKSAAFIRHMATFVKPA